MNRAQQPSAADLKVQAEGVEVSAAKARFAAACALPTDGLPAHGVRWGAYAQRIRDAIPSLLTPIEVLHFAQTKIGFEHRGDIRHEGKFTAMYDGEIAASFPQFADRLNEFADIADSAPNTTYEYKGRLISNVLFYLVRIVLSSFTYLPTAPEIIMEVGGGYGALARIWMKNPIARPRCYVILDMPESLFFADVFLRKEFGDDAVHYVTSSGPVMPETLEKFRFILCPLPAFAATRQIPVDLVINTGSLQEMAEEWVDFYKSWLDRQRCRWFYSLNYFAQPIEALWESGNLLSPRLGSGWRARLLRWNPAFIRMQSERNYLEAIYEKDDEAPDPQLAAVAMDLYLDRPPTGEGFAELMDVVRRGADPAVMLRVLDYAMRMPAAPKEALWLAETLLRQPLSADDRDAVERWRRVLADRRASGVEAYY